MSFTTFSGSRLSASRTWYSSPALSHGAADHDRHGEIVISFISGISMLCALGAHDCQPDDDHTETLDDGRPIAKIHQA